MNFLTRRNLIIVGVLAILVLLAFWVVPAVVSPKPTNTVQLNYNVAETTKVTLNLNGKQITNSTTQLSLGNGNYTLTAVEDGYQNFTASFILAGNDQITVNIKLIPKSLSTITNLNQIQRFDGGTNPIINNLDYFYDGTWAVITFTSNSDPATLIAHYDVLTNLWLTTVGPGTSFKNVDVSSLPQKVKDFLSLKGYVN
jgi:uncharacterized protein YxeA